MTKQNSNKSYSLSRLNATTHGILSKHTVLPCESSNEYNKLYNSLVTEHHPIGTTELHLVEKLAGIIWRKKRLKIAEKASFITNLTNKSSKRIEFNLKPVMWLKRR